MRTVSTDYRLSDQKIRDFVAACRKQFGYGAKLVNTSIRISTSTTRSST